MANENKYIVVFGVSGSGKTLISKMLAQNLKIRFVEGDDFHPAANVNKMRSGHALTDADRIPWLEILKTEISKNIAKNQGFALSCSALKVSYRNLLREAGALKFVFLNVPEKTILERLKNREGHFMPVSLLHSQVETLEEPSEKEKDVLTLDASKAPEEIVNDILSEIR